MLTRAAGAVDSALVSLPNISLVCGLLILVGLVGIVLPVLPGIPVILASVLVWAIVAADPVGWGVLGAAVGVAALGLTLQYLIPGRRMLVAGVPRRSIVLGAVVGIVGFFVVPVVGLVLGFVGGVFLAETVRLQSTGRAWSSTVVAVRAAMVSYGIELSAGLVIAAMWLFAVWRLLV